MTVENKVLSKSRWLDAVKGLGIILVAAGHLFSGYGKELIYIFHMPLFFFVSGYLFKINNDGFGYFVKKVRHLMIPYIAFLIVLGGPRLVKLIFGGDGGADEALRLLIGGRGVGGMMAVFWFVTCLFITQQIMNFAMRKWSMGVVVVVAVLFLLLGYVNATHSEIWLPLNANAALAAVPYFLIGYFFKNKLIDGVVFLLASIASIIGAVLLYVGIGLPQDLKNAVYGVPFLSFVIAIGMILVFMRFSLLISKVARLGVVVSSIGRNSMGIMFMHMPIAVLMLRMLPNSSAIFRFSFAVTLSYVIALLLNRCTLTRVIFLGSGEPLFGKEKNFLR